MASGVDAALRQVAGETLMSELAASGRYRRDVY
jgi:sulfite reductase (NADPH) flavoprotein alpha-component